MSKTAIVTDSSCDLPHSILEKLSIRVVPLVVRFGEEAYSENEITREEFWRRAEITLPFTSGAPLGAFVSVFQELVNQGFRVICLTITGRHSNVASTAWSAAREFGDKVTVIDSQSISWGLGWQVIAAAEAASRGLPLEEIVAIVEDVRSRVSIALVLDTISFLRRGGRADHFITAIDKAARTLNIKPILTFSSGEMRLSALSRTWERGVRRIFTEFMQKMPFESFAIGHTFRQERAEQFADELSSLTDLPRERIQIFETGSAIASHSGPGLLAALALAKG